MIIGRREIPIKREQAAEWLKEYATREEDSDLRDFLAEKLRQYSWDGIEVDMGPDLGVMALEDVILDEVNSYG